MIDYIGLKNGIKALNNLLVREDARELFEDSNYLNEFAKLIRDNLCSDLAEINLEIQNGNHSNQYIPDIIPEGKRLLKLTDDLNGFPPMIIGQLICLRDSLQNVIEVWGSVCGAGKNGFNGKETDREKDYFVKAIKAGLMEKTDGGYRWLHNNGLKASLGYFLNRVFNPRGTAPIPYQRMESLFNVSRLDTAIGQALTAKKPQKWRKEIDTLFDD